MNAFLFVPLLAATWAIGFVYALFAAHYFLTVLESTASGSDRVIWSDDPLIDWFWKGFYLAVLGGVWLTPIIVLGRAITNDPGTRFTFAVIGFWLCFPIGIISSQSATSPWIPFWPGVFARMSQRKMAVLGFYALSIPIALAFAVPFYLVAFSIDTSFTLSVLLAPVAAAGFLIYARALGRLGLVLSFTKGGNNERTRSRKQKKKESPQIGEHTEQPIQMQPSELPPVQTPFEGAITGYDVVFDDRPIPETPSQPSPLSLGDDDDEDGEPLQLDDTDSESQSQSKPPLPEPSASEMALWDKARRPKEPAQPYDATLFTFLGEQRTISAWILLAGGLALLGGMIRMMREFRPG